MKNGFSLFFCFVLYSVEGGSKQHLLLIVSLGSQMSQPSWLFLCLLTKTRQLMHLAVAACSREIVCFGLLFQRVLTPSYICL